MAKRIKNSNLSIEERLEQALIPNWDEPYKLPENWCWVNLGSLGSLGMGQTILSKDLKEEGIPVYSATEENKIFGYISESENTTKLCSGDIVIPARGNSIGHVKYISCDEASCTQTTMFFKPFNKSIGKYVYYYMLGNKHKLFAYHGNAIPQITITNIIKKEIPLPPLEEQLRMVERIEILFDKLDEAKEKAQEVIDGFESRKAAILHKAFSGELTAKWREQNEVSIDSWTNVTISDVCKVNPPKINTKDLADDLEVSFFPMPALSEVYGEITEPQTRKLKEVKTGFTNFSEGDVVFAKITPCMENGKSAVIGKLVNNIGYGTTEFYVLRCNGNLYNRYLYHLVRSKTFRDEAKCVMTGAVGQQRVPKSFIEEYNLNLPSFCEQEKIVSILDSFFEREQKSKETAETTIEQIDIMKKAILSRAFRGELGTNDPSEESAIELLKQVLNTVSEPKKSIKRTTIPKALDNRIKTDLEHKIIKLYFQNEVDVLSIDLIMGVSSKKFEIMEALRDLQQRGLIEKQNDKYKLLG